MEKIDKAIEILQAFKEGKGVEYLSNDRWYGTRSLTNVLNYLNKDTSLIRIVPEKQYRPYVNAEEFLKASKEHGPYLTRGKCEVFRMPVAADNEGVFLDFEHYRSTYEDLLNYGMWYDNTKCGILEQ